MSEIESMKPPVEPERPQYYTVPPAKVQEAFIVNLPPGEYLINFILTDGRVLEGSEKMVVSFERRRSDGVGFDIIPGDRWTRPVQNKTTSSVIYVDGSTDLYLRPFYQDEFNDLYYKRMVSNDNIGNLNLYNWVKIQQVPGARLEIEEGGKSKKIVEEEQFMVEQTEGSGLGYKIIPFDSSVRRSDEKPSLIAFHIPLSESRRMFKLRVFGKDDVVLSGSQRQVRVLDKSGREGILLVFCLLPIIVMGVVIGLRSKKYTS
jgi:hypothetical protein